jgi:hypothetical protein
MARPTYSVDKSRQYSDTHRATLGVFATNTVRYSTEFGNEGNI